MNSGRFVRFVLVALVVAAAAPVEAQQSDKVQVAIGFLREACVTSGRRLEIKGDVGGALTLKKLWDANVGASVTVDKIDQSGFVSGVNAEGQASEMRVCMQPYIKQILDVILGTPNPNPNASWILVQRIEQSITTGNHNCEHNCRNEPTRTGYTVTLSAPGAPDNHPRMLREPQLRCATGPCGGWNAVTVQPAVMPDGLQARASFDVWSLPTTWILSANYYEFK
jgi:hypothetical protein